MEAVGRDELLRLYSMKIALVSTGLGHVWRGYERFTHDLFHLVQEDVDITLFKGGGEARPREIVLPHLKRDGVLSRIPLLCQGIPRSPYYFEVLSFFLALIPKLERGRFDLVHFSDCPLANFLYHARTKMGLRWKTLFTNGNPVTDGSLRRVDFLHQLTPGQVATVVGSGIEKPRIVMVPFGVHERKFQKEEIGALYDRYGIPKDKKIILAVSAINRTHKRIDYLVREVAKLDAGYFLLVLGHLEDSSLVREAERALGNRFNFLHVPFDEADRLYHFADLFVICSLDEGFGLAAVEAMLARIPIIAHHSPNFKWMVGDERCLADLSLEGTLAKQIQNILGDQSLASEIVERNYNSARQRFEWSVLKERYLDMYHRIANRESVSEGGRTVADGRRHCEAALPSRAEAISHPGIASSLLRSSSQ